MLLCGSRRLQVGVRVDTGFYPSVASDVYFFLGGTTPGGQTPPPHPPPPF